MTGDVVVFKDIPIVQGAVYDELVRPNPELDELTKQLLELQLTGFLLVCARQLKVGIK